MSDSRTEILNWWYDSVKKHITASPEEHVDRLLKHLDHAGFIIVRHDQVRRISLDD